MVCRVLVTRSFSLSWFTVYDSSSVIGMFFNNRRDMYPLSLNPLHYTPTPLM